jgi:hypothetical protein
MRARHLEGRAAGSYGMGLPVLSTLRSFQMGGGLLDQGVEGPPRVWCLNVDGFRWTSIFFCNWISVNASWRAGLVSGVV